MIISRLINVHNQQSSIYRDYLLLGFTDSKPYLLSLSQHDNRECITIHLIADNEK